MIALPLTLLGLAIAVALVRLADSRWESADRKSADQADQRSVSRGPNPQSETEPSPWRIALPDLLPILLLGLVVGALRATNTWDFPTYVLVGLAALVVAGSVRRSRHGLAAGCRTTRRWMSAWRSSSGPPWR